MISTLIVLVSYVIMACTFKFITTCAPLISSIKYGLRTWGSKKRGLRSTLGELREGKDYFGQNLGERVMSSLLLGGIAFCAANSFVRFDLV